MLETNPLAAIDTQPAVPPPMPKNSCEVEAVPVTVRIDEVAKVEKRLVKVPLVEKKLVLVLLVEVLLIPVKFWNVDDP